jgi:hypothetical protein
LIEEADNKRISNFELTEIMELRKKKNPKRRDVFVSKSLVLIYAHMFRKPIPAELAAEYDDIIKFIPKIIAVTQQNIFASLWQTTHYSSPTEWLWTSTKRWGGSLPSIWG